MLRPEGVPALIRAIEAVGMPVFLTGMARGLLGREHPLLVRHRRREALAEAEGLEVREEMFRLHDLYSADEFFITGTAAEVVPGVKVDGRLIADGKPGPITQRLRKRYQELTTTEGTPIK